MKELLPMLEQRRVGDNLWFYRPGRTSLEVLERYTPKRLTPEVHDSEDDVGTAMLAELDELARQKTGDLVIIILGGRGAQALHRLLGERARTRSNNPHDNDLISRLHVFTQDALAPMRMGSSLSFVRDFERLLGDEFFRQVRSFTTVRTDSPDVENEVRAYIEKLDSLGGADIFFLGHGPEPEGRSHLAYIKPASGATAVDVAGLIPISSSIVEHHITKFKAGGSSVNADDEAECRSATHIFTLGPAAILSSRRIVQSIVDAETAPAKRVTYRRVLETELSADLKTLESQLDENPGLWVRLHPDVRSLVLPNVLVSNN
jgi:6-phosphogluconolactonase/glucosamine-6-phosphate isomerase/deaminase